MDTESLLEAIPTINHLSTAASIACVLPTYFLRLQPATYRLVLSLGIIFGLSTLAVAVATIVWPVPHQLARWVIVLQVVAFSPFVVVLIAIFASVAYVTRVGIWSTVVLACVLLDWGGISALLFALS